MTAMLAAAREAAGYHDLLRNLLARDLKVRYKHSALGFFWSLLRPLLVIAVLVVVFQGLLETSIPHFAPFIVIGYLVWSFAADALSVAVRSVVANAALVKRVYFPESCCRRQGCWRTSSTSCWRWRSCFRCCCCSASR